MKNYIAIIDNDQNTLLTLPELFKEEGHVVRTYTDSRDACEYIYQKAPKLVLADVQMSAIDGLTLLQKIKTHSSIPFVYLSAKRDEVDELVALKLGADDFILKPFSSRVVLERINAILRRYTRPLDDGCESVEKEIKVGALVINSVRHSCCWNGQHVNLTKREFLIMAALAKNPGQLKTREFLLNHAWGHGIYVEERSVDSHIKRIRRKFSAVDRSFSNIDTVYGIGYRYCQQT